MRRFAGRCYRVLSWGIWAVAATAVPAVGAIPAGTDDVTLDSPASSFLVRGQSPCDSCDCPCCEAEVYSRVVCDTCCDTIHESLCGDATAWRPLTLDTFFSEGWNEAWAGGPAGQSGLTPRHGWLGAFEGTFYRLWLVNSTYQHDLNQPYGGDFYGGNFTTFLPFNRRFEVFVNVPFISANGTADADRGYRADFGDIQVAGSFLLAESAAATHLLTIGATAPTGQSETGGDHTAINPRYSFWSNPCGAWVVRGGTGVNIPLNDSTALTTLNVGMAVGRYFRPHDVPLGDLVFYVNGTVNVPLEDGGPTTVGVGPGTRFQIAGDWYFLHYWEFQVGDTKPFDTQIQTAIVKAW